MGTPESGRKFCSKLPFPEDTLFVDPERRAYEVLQLYKEFAAPGSNGFDALSKTWNALQKRGLDSVRDAAKNYEMIPPPNNDLSAVTQQGGLFVFDGDKVLYAWRDGTVADHAPMEEIMGACCPAAA